MLFSERNIYKDNPLILNNISKNCKTRILNRFNVFFKIQLNIVSSIYILNILWDRLGYKVDLDLYELENEDIRDLLMNQINRIWYALGRLRKNNITQYNMKIKQAILHSSSIFNRINFKKGRK